MSAAAVAVLYLEGTLPRLLRQWNPERKSHVRRPCQVPEHSPPTLPFMVMVPPFCRRSQNKTRVSGGSCVGLNQCVCMCDSAWMSVCADSSWLRCLSSVSSVWNKWEALRSGYLHEPGKWKWTYLRVFIYLFFISYRRHWERHWQTELQYSHQQ